MLHIGKQNIASHCSFVCEKNVSYTVVTEFMIQSETSEHILEALSMLYICAPEEWQKELLTRYGNTLTLIDATYRKTKYSIPLFFCV